MALSKPGSIQRIRTYISLTCNRVNMEAIGSKVLFLILWVCVAGKIIYSWWNHRFTAWFGLSVLVISFINLFLPTSLPLSLFMDMYSELTSGVGQLNT